MIALSLLVLAGLSALILSAPKTERQPIRVRADQRRAKHTSKKG